MTEFRTEQFTHKGGRRNNEDYCGHLMLADFVCWTAADGAGGHEGGEIASETAVTAILDVFRDDPGMSSEHLWKYLRTAHSAIIKKQEVPGLNSMRTTIAVLVSDYKSAMWAHAGDTRLYMLKDGRVLFQTKDHSMPQVLADSGQISAKEIRYHQDRNRLLKSLGVEGALSASVMEDKVPAKEGDAFLICTDGFWEHITETEMEIDLAKSETPQQWLLHMRGRLARRVDGEYDNYSAVAVIVQ
ncbi:MAG: protein phosphatase 2C domain-containing protein [Candidatus Magnetominusculus sp. LBB02]|nr:protein phosphatase 2C domain-containing protein [Candidatus Magnetominusculus sp. LBB02]